MFTLTAEELDEFEQLSLLENADLVNISMMTDTGLDESTDENAEDTLYPTWEEADQNEEQLQSEQCVWEMLESYLSDADNDPIHLEMHDMAEFGHDIHYGTAWDKEDLAQHPDKRIRIVMMDCGDELGDLAKTEYSTLDQFQEISNMLGENAVKIAAQHEYTDAYDFRERLQEALMEDMPTMIQINAEKHTDDGILSNNT